MFVGHYSASLAARAAEPRAPLWTYVVAAQFMDIGWSGLVLAGVEKLRVDPSLPGSALDLYHMPWTHSLPGALGWSVAGGLIARFVLRLPARAAALIAAVVFSHWLLDLLVHRPDLELWFGGPKVGLGLWNSPVLEQAVEIGLLAVAGAWWVGERVREGRRIWPAALFLAGLVGLQIVGMVMPPGGDPAQMGVTALVAYLVVGGVAWLIDRRPVDAAARLPAAASRA
jgi:hypothetical protein